MEKFFSKLSKFVTIINGRWNGNDVAAIRFESGDDTTNKDDGRITFNVSSASSSPAEAMRIEPNGAVLIGTTTEGNVSAEQLTVEGSGNTGITLKVQQQQMN